LLKLGAGVAGSEEIYNDFAASAEWQRLQFMAIALLTIALSFFYHNLTGKLSVKTLIIITIINIPMQNSATVFARNVPKNSILTWI